ncbi:General transcription factor 3C polypeptide 2, partial [Paramuricea clavata]
KEHNSENDEESEFSGSEQTTNKEPRRPSRGYRKVIDYRKKTKAWYKAFLAGNVLTCWRPSLKHWKKFPASEAEHYLPVRKMSPVFKIEAVNKKKWTPEQDKEYQLPLFSSAPINSAGGLCNVTFNVGGSVWAMDWAPIPVGEENCDQYLAIGCHSDPDKKHLLSECYKEKGVLQIWRVPKLRNGIRPTEQPEFCLGIVHDYGPVWDARWCPSGAWDPLSPQDGELRRLGLLALACADGRVRIFSVPFPCSLMKNDGGEAGKSPSDILYRAVPHMVLSPGSLCRKYQDECGPAWTVSWQPINGHNKVIASYADGTVAIWNLKTENRILKAATPDGLTE